MNNKQTDSTFPWACSVNRWQTTTKCGTNKEAAKEAQPSVSLMFLPKFSRLMWSITVQTQANLESMFDLIEKKSTMSFTMTSSMRLSSNRSQVRTNQHACMISINLHIPTPTPLLIFDRRPFPRYKFLSLPQPSKMAPIILVQKTLSTRSPKLRLEFMFVKVTNSHLWKTSCNGNISSWNYHHSRSCKSGFSLICYEYFS